MKRTVRTVLITSSTKRTRLFTVSDEALEKAAGGIAWPPMLIAVATIWPRETVAVTCCDHSSTIHNE
jgi:hypothetical protein